MFNLQSIRINVTLVFIKVPLLGTFFVVTGSSKVHKLHPPSWKDEGQFQRRSSSDFDMSELKSVT